MARSFVRRTGGGLIPVHQLPLPRGATREMRDAARLARVRHALGPQLAPHLIRIAAAGAQVTLVFGGAGWEEQLAGFQPDLERRLARAFGREAIQLTIRSTPVAAPTMTAAAVALPGDSTARLRRAAARILARRGQGPGQRDR